MTEKLKYKIASSFLRGITPEKISRIISVFGSIENFFLTSAEETIALMQCEDPMFTAESKNKALEKADSEISWLRASKGVTPLFYTDDEYPARLAGTPDAPVMLYVAGNTAGVSAGKTIAMVGTRSATPYGETFIRDFLKDVAVMYPGTTVISGLAYGIDIMSHRAAMENNLPTYAVVAHGLDTIYPSVHRAEARGMVTGCGGVVSRYPHGVSGHPGNFLERNKIIAALSDAVIIVESDTTGGAMATARHARRYGREVFALPGRVTDKYSRGCNRLISEGKALMLTSAADLGEALGWQPANSEGTQITLPLETETSPVRRQILDYLLKTEVECEDFSLLRLSGATGVESTELNIILGEMEFDGLLKKLPGGKYQTIKHI